MKYKVQSTKYQVLSMDSDSYNIIGLDSPKKIANAELRLKNEEGIYNYLSTQHDAFYIVLGT